MNVWSEQTWNLVKEKAQIALALHVKTKKRVCVTQHLTSMAYCMLEMGQQSIIHGNSHYTTYKCTLFTSLPQIKSVRFIKDAHIHLYWHLPVWMHDVCLLTAASHWTYIVFCFVLNCFVFSYLYWFFEKSKNISCQTSHISHNHMQTWNPLLPLYLFQHKTINIL